MHSDHEPFLLDHRGPESAGRRSVTQVQLSSAGRQAHRVHVGDTLLLHNTLKGRHATPAGQRSVGQSEDTINSGGLEVGRRLSGRSELNRSRGQSRTREVQHISVDRARDLRSISILVVESALVAVASSTVVLRA